MLSPSLIALLKLSKTTTSPKKLFYHDCMATMIKYLSLNIPRYLTEVSVRLLYTLFRWAFVLQQLNLPFSKSQYKRPPKLRVQQTCTYLRSNYRGR